MAQFVKIAKLLNQLKDESSAKSALELNSRGRCCFRITETVVAHSTSFAFPRFSDLDQHSFIVDTDASDLATTAVLLQMQDGQERPIAFAYWTLTKQERNYCVTGKELVVVFNG